MSDENMMKDLVSLCKRRGFVFPASDIYGGINGFWDYGPLGVELKNNLRDLWWKWMVLCPPLGPEGTEYAGAPVSMVGLDSSIIQNPKTWEASGHVAGFTDPMVDCRETKLRYRADHLVVYSYLDSTFLFAFNKETSLEDVEKKIHKFAKKRGSENIRQIFELGDFTKVIISDELKDRKYNYHSLDKIVAPDTLEPGTLTEPRQFNLMLDTYPGVIRDEAHKAYLRPETAQGIFLNFKNVLDSSRVKIPFGIAQIGKAFRNEVTPRNFIYRSREFEQMEMEWFCHPSEAKLWRDFWFVERQKFWTAIGLAGENLQMRDHDKDELSHYAKAGYGTADIEYRFPFTAPGFGELEGIAHRCDFDLTQHQKISGQKLEYFDQERNERYIPHVIEPAAGLTRGVLALLAEAYTLDPNRPSGVYLNFHPAVAPKKAAILPLTAKEDHVPAAQKLYMALREDFAVDLDIKQNIGKRYARQDEIGTPYCFTIDDQTNADGTVTARERNTMAQERVSMDRAGEYLREKIKPAKG
ncbi:MAG: glycine--tRNA ligase [Rhodospirillales bacterium]|nr:glycine--tRNA ligase [Rhodospirillales bacterium]